MLSSKNLHGFQFQSKYLLEKHSVMDGIRSHKIAEKWWYENNKRLQKECHPIIVFDLESTHVNQITFSWGHAFHKKKKELQSKAPLFFWLDST